MVSANTIRFMVGRYVKNVITKISDIIQLKIMLNKVGNRNSR